MISWGLTLSGLGFLVPIFMKLSLSVPPLILITYPSFFIVICFFSSACPSSFFYLHHLKSRLMILICSF